MLICYWCICLFFDSSIFELCYFLFPFFVCLLCYVLVLFKLLMSVFAHCFVSFVCCLIASIFESLIVLFMFWVYLYVCVLVLFKLLMIIFDFVLFHVIVSNVWFVLSFYGLGLFRPLMFIVSVFVVLFVRCLIVFMFELFHCLCSLCWLFPLFVYLIVSIFDLCYLLFAMLRFVICLWCWCCLSC